MHTPDGFLTSWVCVITLLITIAMVVFSLVKAKEWMTKEKAFLMAGLAASIFGFQMLNFSIGNGTSGHLIGGAIVAILLGPKAAVLVLSSVLLVQTFIYGDGGVLAIGVNIFLMGIVPGYVAHWIYQPLKKKMPLVSGVLASFVSVIAASFVAALLLGISGTISFEKVIPAMLLTHLFIGIGEGLITGGFLVYIQKTKNDLLHKNKTKNIFKYVAFSTFGALMIMSFALPFASESPDGLEKVALNLGFFEKATKIYSLSPMPDYTLLGQESYIFVLLSGIIGMLLTFGVSYAIARPIASET
jgi:cobalt/nickel transport system permease protein